MWRDELRRSTSRVHRRRVLAGIGLGTVLGAGWVAIAVGMAPGAVAAVAAVVVAAIAGAGWLLGSPAERALDRLDREPFASEPDEVRETRLGAFGRFRVTPRVLVIERLLRTTAARIEDLAWVYGVHDPGSRWIPFLPDASLVLKFGNGAEITLRCLGRQVTPCLSAIRHFAGHVALGWDPEVARSWELDRPAFVASVQARLGRVSGAGE